VLPRERPQGCSSNCNWKYIPDWKSRFSPESGHSEVPAKESNATFSPLPGSWSGAARAKRNEGEAATQSGSTPLDKTRIYSTTSCSRVRYLFAPSLARLSERLLSIVSRSRATEAMWRVFWTRARNGCTPSGGDRRCIGPRPRDITYRTQTPAAPGADTRAHGPHG